MDAAEIRSIADAWISRPAGNRTEDDKNFWAFVKLYDLCEEAPEEAWLITQYLLSKKLDTHQKALVAAGPIEALLVKHGKLFIERFEDLAERDSEFKGLLGGVWKNRMEDDIWRRIQAVAGPQF
jgi:hypothetical protein